MQPSCLTLPRATSRPPRSPSLQCFRRVESASKPPNLSALRTRFGAGVVAGLQPRAHGHDLTSRTCRDAPPVFDDYHDHDDSLSDDPWASDSDEGWYDQEAVT